MANKNQIRINIIGGSLSGLYTAHSLLAAGYNVHIYEKHDMKGHNDRGAGIVVQSDTVKALIRYHCIQSIDQISVIAHYRQYFNRQGDITSREDYTQHMTSWGTLYQALITKFPSERYHSNHEFIDYDINQKKHQLNATIDEHQQSSVNSGSDTSDHDEDNHHDEVRNHSSNSRTVRHKIECDLLIGADGQYSTLRRKLLNHHKSSSSSSSSSSSTTTGTTSSNDMRYAGYVAWRGVIDMSEVSQELKDIFYQKFSWFMDTEHHHTHILCYTIPGGTMTKGSHENDRQYRLNWVWYWNVNDQNSDKYRSLFTDKKGKQHLFSMNAGSVRDEHIEKQRKIAHDVLSPQFIQLLDATPNDHWFLQAIVDYTAPQMVYENGKVVLLGDASAVVRPHTAASTSKAAHNAMSLADILSEEEGIDMNALKRWEEEEMNLARKLESYGQRVGNSSQYPDKKIDKLNSAPRI